MRFSALHQRISDPELEMGFFDGNTRAPKIELAFGRGDPNRSWRRLEGNLWNSFTAWIASRLKRTKQNWMTMGNSGRFGADAKDVSAGDAHRSDAQDTPAAFTVV